MLDAAAVTAATAVSDATVLCAEAPGACNLEPIVVAVEATRAAAMELDENRASLAARQQALTDTKPRDADDYRQKLAAITAGQIDLTEATQRYTTKLEAQNDLVSAALASAAKAQTEPSTRERPDSESDSEKSETVILVVVVLLVLILAVVAVLVTKSRGDTHTRSPEAVS